MANRGQTRAERKRQRRREFWANQRAELRDRGRTEMTLSRAEHRDFEAAVARGDADRWEGFSIWVHLALTFVTFGLWLPVLIWVAIRNHYRERRTPWGRAAVQRRAEAQRDVKTRANARNRAHARQQWRDLGDDLRRVTGRRRP